MDAKLKRKVAIGAAGLAVVASGGIAYAATQDPGAADRQAILSDAAKRLNVSPDQLNSALQGAYSDQIDKAEPFEKMQRSGERFDLRTVGVNDALAADTDAGRNGSRFEQPLNGVSQ